MRNRRLVKVVAALAGLAMLAAACGDDDDSGSGDDGGDGGGEVQEFSIAFVGPLTGERRQPRHLHPRRRQGRRRAVQRGARRRVQITLEEFDTQGDPAQAPTVLDEYIGNEDILGLVGPAFSGETRAVLPTLTEEGLVMVSASATNPELPDVVPGGGVVPPGAPRRRRPGGRCRQVPDDDAPAGHDRDRPRQQRVRQGPGRGPARRAARRPASRSSPPRPSTPRARTSPPRSTP